MGSSESKGKALDHVEVTGSAKSHIGCGKHNQRKPDANVRGPLLFLSKRAEVLWIFRRHFCMQRIAGMAKPGDQQIPVVGSWERGNSLGQRVSSWNDIAVRLHNDTPHRVADLLLCGHSSPVHFHRRRLALSLPMN